MSSAEKKLFISYKLKDKEIAETIDSALIDISDNLLPPDLQFTTKLCDRYLSSGEWFNIIHDELDSAKYFIFLYTDPNADYSWCIYEAGIFLGRHRELLKGDKILDSNRESVYSKNFFLLSPEHADKRPAPFEHYQVTTAVPEKITKMLKRIILDDDPDYSRSLGAYWWEANEMDSKLETYVKKIIKSGISNLPTIDCIFNADERYITFESGPVKRNEATYLQDEQASGTFNPEVRKWSNVGDLFSKLPNDHRSNLHHESVQWRGLSKSVGGPLLDAIEKNVRVLLDPNTDNSKCDLPDKIVPVDSHSFIPVISKHSKCPTGLITFNVNFLKLGNMSKPILDFNQLITHIIDLFNSAPNDTIYFVARTPALGCLAVPEAYEKLKDVILANAKRIYLVTYDEKKLAEFHADLQGKMRDGQIDTINKEDVDKANLDSVEISKQISEEQHYLIEELPDYYIFRNNNTSIVITPSFFSKIKHTTINMFGLVTNDRKIHDHTLRRYQQLIQGDYGDVFARKLDFEVLEEATELFRANGKVE